MLLELFKEMQPAVPLGLVLPDFPSFSASGAKSLAAQWMIEYTIYIYNHFSIYTYIYIYVHIHVQCQVLHQQVPRCNEGSLIDWRHPIYWHFLCHEVYGSKAWNGLCSEEAQVEGRQAGCSYSMKEAVPIDMYYSMYIY